MIATGAMIVIIDKVLTVNNLYFSMKYLLFFCKVPILLAIILMSVSNEVIWWSHGGTLKGESVPRFAFLKRIMEETSPEGLNSLDHNWMWLRFSAGRSDKALLFYFGEHQPARWPLNQAKENTTYTAEVIDTWNMTVTPIDGNFIKGSEIPLPGKPYMALRVWEVKE